jgi:ankyrin repeat protein
MHEAAANGQIESMQLLLQHGADINGTPGTPWSDMCSAARSPPIQCAVAAGHDETIQWILEQGADAGPGLKTAAETDNLSAARLLLDRGSATMLTWGGPAFRVALTAGHVAMAHLLLSAGPPNYFMSAAPPHPGVTLLDLGFCVSHFRERHDDHTMSELLRAAVQHGHTGFAQMLRQRGVVLPSTTEEE